MKLTLSQLAHFPAPVRIGAFVLILLLIWVPLAGPIALLIPDHNTVSILTLLLLYVEFILLVQVWGRRVYKQTNLLWRYGLELSHSSGLELFAGLAIGLVSLLALFGTQSLLGWVSWHLNNFSPQVALEGLLVAFGIGFAEELLFRGWLLDELQRDYRLDVVLWSDAILYAALHGFRAQFPALLLLGLTLVWAKRSCGERWYGGWHERLALPMGLHAGLVWGYYLVNVGQLVDYSEQVSPWLTGLDHNPLSGAIGLLFLTGLALGMRQFSIRQANQPLSFPVGRGPK